MMKIRSRLKISAFIAKRTLFFGVVIGICFSFLQTLNPLFEESRYRKLGTEEWHEFSMPFYLDPGPLGTFEIETVMVLPRINSTTFQFIPDDCLDKLVINGYLIEGAKFCEFRSGRELKLGPYLHSGRNTIIATIRNTGWPTGLRINIGSTDPLRLFIYISMLVVIGLYGMSVVKSIFPLMSRFQLLEYWFLWTFLAAKILLFISRKNHAIGFDVGPHMEMFWKFSWPMSMGGVRQYFLSYHPPFAFGIAKGIFTLGENSPIPIVFDIFQQSVVSVQFTSFFSLIVAFFFLRATLQRLGILHTFHGIAFLYFSSSLPILVHMSTSINIDSIVFALTSVLLYCLTQFFWNTEKRILRRRKFLQYFCLAIISIALALMTKFSGFLLIALPIFVVLEIFTIESLRSWIKKFAMALCMIAVAVAVVFPYYYLRYYKNEGTFIPTNTKWVISRGHEYAIRRRDEDRVRFLKVMFRPEYPIYFPTSKHIDTMRWHNNRQPRLSDAWTDIWIADPAPLTQVWPSVKISLFYLQVMPWILSVGAIMSFMCFFLQKGAWSRLGRIFVLYGLLQVVALVYYAFNNPDPGFKPTKAIYIVASTWMLAYFCINAFYEILAFIKRRNELFYAIIGIVLLLTVAIFMIINHIVPVY